VNGDRRRLVGAMLAGAAAGACTTLGGNVDTTRPNAQADMKAVAELDTQYQAAVERNDAETMARIHHEDMTLVISSGAVITGKFLEQRAREKFVTYERQVEVDNSQVVRVSGDTAVVTAKLWIKGMRGKDAIDYKLWFSDTYVRTSTGWRYFFGQAGAPLKE
jgi:ketosteroid isomerase-like protein